MGMKKEHSEQIEVLYRQHFRAMVVHAYRFVGDWERATEAAQEAFRIACEKPDALVSSPNPIGWLKQTTRNVCSNILKQQRLLAKLLVSLEKLTDPELPYVVDIRSDELDELRSITDKESIDILKKIFLHGYSYREVADSYGISVWACYKRVQRVIGKIKKAKKDVSKS